MIEWTSQFISIRITSSYSLVSAILLCQGCMGGSHRDNHLKLGVGVSIFLLGGFFYCLFLIDLYISFDCLCVHPCSFLNN